MGGYLPLKPFRFGIDQRLPELPPDAPPGPEGELPESALPQEELLSPQDALKIFKQALGSEAASVLERKSTPPAMTASGTRTIQYPEPPIYEDLPTGVPKSGWKKALLIAATALPGFGPGYWGSVKEKQRQTTLAQ